MPGLHVHPNQEERFEVTSGTMKFRYGMQTIVAGPGEVVVVPPGKGMPKPLDLALFVEEFRDEVRAPFPPAPIVKAMMAPLRAIARRRDYRKTSRRSSQTHSTAPAAA